ncbi:hypothetical protein D0T90_06505 [Neisseria animalis]|uniref:Uncharacterized protein n=1 Tax=Neisseria animalis TaxID=492 RepID=A0A5P3MTT9_NEIAN|nr:hypothetical protein D0T90_06505 [Neisseria animalis]ROW32210.1 hypothetical protein CGZ60_06485 [Neisseria animalis]
MKQIFVASLQAGKTAQPYAHHERPSAKPVFPITAAKNPNQTAGNTALYRKKPRNSRFTACSG